MGAKYAMYENPNPKGDGKKQPLHARIVSRGTIRTEEIAQDIAESCGYSTGVTKGMLDALAHIVSRYLKRGYTVELNELGTFSISLKSRPVMDKKEIRSWSIGFGNVHFRGNKKLKERLKLLDLERADEGESTSFTPQQRKKRALEYLKDHDYINRVLYMQINGCNHSTAIADLKKMTESEQLKKLGSGKAVLYIAVK